MYSDCFQQAPYDHSYKGFRALSKMSFVSQNYDLNCRKKTTKLHYIVITTFILTHKDEQDSPRCNCQYTFLHVFHTCNKSLFVTIATYLNICSDICSHFVDDKKKTLRKAIELEVFSIRSYQQLHTIRLLVLLSFIKIFHSMMIEELRRQNINTKNVCVAVVHYYYIINIKTNENAIASRNIASDNTEY